MGDLGKSVFNMQRFMILQLAVNPNTKRDIPLYYTYAWYSKIYPFLEENELHEDLEEYFEITKNQVDILSKFLDDEWLDGRTYSFYELEDIYDINTENPKYGFDRIILIKILRYFRLHLNSFDQQFWDKLLESGHYPVEASLILTDFTEEDIFII